MGNQSPDARFGIKVGGKRSPYWRVRAGMAKPELFAEREGLDKHFHVSLHVRQWQMKVGRQIKAYWPNRMKWSRATPARSASCSQ